GAASRRSRSARSSAAAVAVASGTGEAGATIDAGRGAGCPRPAYARDAKPERPGWRVRRASLGAGWAWGIGAAALLLSVWAVLDFVEAIREEAARGVVASPAAEPAPPSPLDAIELHRLLPDATDDLGALVRVDGT